MLKVRCQARVTLDAKKRLALPVALRKAFRQHDVDSLVLSHHDGGIWGWTPEEFESRIEAPLDAADPFSRDVLDFTRTLLGSAEDAAVDAQGRIRIPLHLVEYGALEREVVVISMLNRIEIWDRERWEQIYRRSVDRVGARSGMPGLH